MRKRPNPRRLLVEGRDEQRLIPELIERNGIIWGNTRDAAIVDIEEFDGIKNLLKAGVIEAEIKASGLQQLGILVDADDDPAVRWNSVRDRCLKSFPNIPSELPADGLIVENQAGLRLGVWILPDNQNSGMLESFLCGMVAESGDTIYQHAVACCRMRHKRKNDGGTFFACPRRKGKNSHLVGVAESVRSADA